MTSMPDPTPTFAETMVSKLETLLAENLGVQEITVDGVTTKYVDLLAQRDDWRRQVTQEQGKRSQILSVDLSGF